jgi:aryl-alcohol dehydrogenase-like predicted oxidoreductase
VPFGPLHGGLLAGTQVEEREFSGDKRFGGSGFTGTELEVGRAVERLSQDWSLQPYQVSLAWLLSRPAVASAIVGAETVEEITAKPQRPTSNWRKPKSTPLTALGAGDDGS